MTAPATLERGPAPATAPLAPEELRLRVEATETVGARLRSFWSDTMVYAGRNLAHIRQIPEKLLDVTLQPLMFVLLFAFVFGGAINMGGTGNYRSYIIAGILFQSLTFGLTGPATSIATDLSEGVVDRFRSLPANRLSYLFGHYAAELGGMALSVVVLMGAGLLVGWRLNNDVLHAAAAFVLVFLFASAMIWVGTWMGLMVRTADAVMGVAFVVIFPLTFISNAFVPIQSMPSALQTFAAWNPISVVVAATRHLFGNPVPPVPHSSWPLQHAQFAAFVYVVVIGVVAVAASIHRFRVRTSD